MTDTKVIGAAMIAGEEVALLVSPATDGTAIELTARQVSGSLVDLKDAYRGKTMTSFWLTVGTPSDLDLVQFLDDNGGVIWEWIGCINAALGHVPQLTVVNVVIPITKGCSFKVTTSD